MEKTKAVAYITYKIRTMDRVQFLEELKHAPIRDIDYQLMIDICAGLSYKELSQKYNLSEARIYQWKRTLYEQLHRYDLMRKPL